MSTDKTFFGHPRGLATLFFTEMWERFSYYGMRALLLLYMVASAKEGGLGLDEKTGGAIYGLYTMLVYLMALPGGWVADNLLGLRKSVFYGGCLIAAGHICMVFTSTEFFFFGLFLIVIGTGLLKPNVSSLVGELYPSHEQARRDAGFSIFYMGINLGAFIAPFITGYLGEQVDWHYGFAVAGMGMIAGLIQYKATDRYLGDAGLHPAVSDEGQKKKARTGVVIVIALLTIVMALLLTRTITADPVMVAKVSAYLIAGSTAFYFLYLLFMARLQPGEKKGVLAIAIFFVASVVFYIGYEQQGSSLNLFAKRYTNMMIGDFEMPASWMQTVPPVSVIVFAPIFAWLWVWLAHRKKNPSTPVKFSFGVLFIALSYVVMTGAALIFAGGTKPLPTWLIATYLLHTFGEICLYPVGLSTVSKLAPRAYTGQMMGVWFLSLSLGNLIAGMLAGELDAARVSANPHVMVTLFAEVAVLSLVTGIAVLLLAKPIRKLMGNVQ